MSKGENVTIHNGDIVLAYLRMIVKETDVRTAQAIAQAAIDFATNDEEALAEGRALQPGGGVDDR